MKAELDLILTQAVELGASDIFVVAGLPLTYKVQGRQQRMEELGPWTPADTRDFAGAVCRRGGRPEAALDTSFTDDDFSFSLPGVGRFRVNLFRQRGSLAAVVRVIRFGLPTAEEMHIPREVMRIAGMKRGIALVTGSAGSGKSTTLACIIDQINHTRTGHILTLEDPVEYIHRHDRCIISQREIPIDCPSYVSALRSALREDPDVILVGEMRDYETISAAVTAAETGHLVMSTLHTIGAAQTIDRIIDVCPAGAQNQIRGQLAAVLRGVITQQLLPLAGGKGRCAATEILVGTDAVANLIREGKCYQIPSILQSGAALGMHSLNADLARLVSMGRITREAAERCATDKSDLQN